MARQRQVNSVKGEGAGGARATALDKVTLFGYVLMFVVGVLIFRSVVWPAPSPIIHTELESGIHVTLVVVAPTAEPPEEMVAIFQEAVAALGHAVREEGMFFSTIGISDDWSVARGLDLLSSFGHFDEVIVGRNWFNSGIMMFVNDLEGPAVVPQLVVVRQEKTIVRGGPWVYGPIEELARTAGLSEMSNWAARGFPIEPSGFSGSARHP